MGKKSTKKIFGQNEFSTIGQSSEILTNIFFFKIEFKSTPHLTFGTPDRVGKKPGFFLISTHPRVFGWVSGWVNGFFWVVQE